MAREGAQLKFIFFIFLIVQPFFANVYANDFSCQLDLNQDPSQLQQSHSLKTTQHKNLLEGDLNQNSESDNSSHCDDFHCFACAHYFNALTSEKESWVNVFSSSQIFISRFQTLRHQIDLDGPFQPPRS